MDEINIYVYKFVIKGFKQTRMCVAGSLLEAITIAINELSIEYGTHNIDFDYMRKLY